MKKLRFYLKYTTCYLIWGLLSFNLNVNATTHNDAVADIMNDDRFIGAISSIEWLTSRVDHWFTMAITATAFFIISSAMLKNVCAGAYCSNNKFWDKVDEAHKKKEGVAFMSYVTGLKDNMQNLSPAGLKDAILAIIPNFKALTDFEDATMEPKHYWMKAIPQMLVCIIIGVFIYNGYYRDTASMVGDFGSAICDRVFSSVDPVAFVDVLTQTTSTPDNIFDADQSVAGKIESTFSKDLYKAYLSVSKGESSSAFKTSLMRDCESHAQKIFDSNLSSNNSSALGAQYNIDSTSRLYDYSISGLKIVVTPYSDVVTKQVFTIDCNEDKSELYVTGYGQAPKTVGDYLSDVSESAYYHYTFTLKGKKSEGTTPGRSNIVASAGNFQSAKISAIDVVIPITSLDPTGTPGNYKSGKNFYEISNFSQLTDQSLLTHVNTQTGKQYSNPRVTWSGTATGKVAFKTDGKYQGQTTTATANVTVTDPESGSDVRFDIPVTALIQ